MKTSLLVLCTLMVLSVTIMAVSGSFLEQIVEMSLSDSRSFKGGSSGGGGGGGKSSSGSSSGGGRSSGGSKSGSSSGGSKSGRSNSSSKSSSASSSKSSSTKSGTTTSGKTSAKTNSKSTVSSKVAAAYSQYAQSRIAGMKNPASTMAGLKAANLNARMTAQPAATVNGKLTAASIKASYQNRMNTKVAAAYQQYAQSRIAGLKAAQPTAKPASVPANVAAAYQQYAQSRIAGLKAATAAKPASVAAAYQQYAQSRIAGLKAATAAKANAVPANVAAAYQQYAQTRIAGLKNPASTLPNSFKIDKGLLTANEGVAATAGYVPQDKKGNVVGKSGVTVGTGFDVGQQSVAGLKALGLSPGLVDKLSPYTGLKQQKAVDALAKNPLSLSAAEVQSIDKAVMDKFSANLARDYAAAAAKNPNAVKNFKDLPAPVQSVAYSVYHQYGSFTKTPNFMNKLSTNDYTGMVHELRNFGDAYSTRRNREADHLESGLKAASG